jgi:hypothetical protein
VVALAVSVLTAIEIRRVHHRHLHAEPIADV